MSTPYAHAGLLVADRFELMFPYAQQPPYADISAWVAQDTVLQRHVRALVFSPDSSHTAAITDAARRAAVITDPRLISIVYVADQAIITELPPGRPLSQRLHDTVPPDQVHAIVGELAAALAAANRHGLRHLQPRASCVYLDDAGDMIVDGLGIFAAAAGAQLNKDPRILDRDEARGLVVFTAALLLGKDFPNNPADHDAIVNKACSVAAPQEVRELLERERSGDGAPSAADIVRQLAPWSEISPELLPTVPSVPTVSSTDTTDGTTDSDDLPADTAENNADTASEDVHADTPYDETSEDCAEEIPDVDDPSEASSLTVQADTGEASDSAAQSRSEAAQLIEEQLGIAGPTALQTAPDWPTPPQSLCDDEAQATSADDDAHNEEPSDADAPTETIATAPRRTSVAPAFVSSQTTGDAAAATEATHDEPVGMHPPTSRTPATAPNTASASAGGSVYTSKVVVIFFVVAVVVIGLLGFYGLFKPLDPVPGANENTSESEQEASEEPEPTEDNQTAEETPAPEESSNKPPEIASASLLNPEAHLFNEADPASQDDPESVPLTVDGDPGTAWKSDIYLYQNMAPVSGIGLNIQLAQEATVTEVTLEIAGEGGNIQIRDTLPDAPSSGKLLAEGPAAGTTTLQLSEPLTAESFVVWITDMPVNPAGQFRAEIAEISVK